MMKRNIILLLLFLICIKVKPQNSFTTALQSFSENEALKNSSWGFTAYRISDSAPLVSVNGNTSLVPASVMKIITTSSALILLGENYQFETQLLTSGKVDDKGVLNGDLIIRGFGDPTLGSERWSDTRLDVIFPQWLEAMRKAGIKTINGNIIGDGSRWDINFVADGWQYDDFGNYYATGAAGLNILENTVKIYFAPSATIGAAAKMIKTEPAVPLSGFINMVKTGGKDSGDQVVVYGSPYASPRILKGTIPFNAKEFVIKASMHDPAATCASVFKSWLESQGVLIKGKTFSIIPGMNELTDTNTSCFHVYKSPALSSIIQLTNYHSINIFAEALFKAISYKLVNSSISTDASTTIQDFLKTRGVQTKGLNIADGCGLSRTNLLTTEQLSGILLLMAKDKRFSVFYESLPTAGINGTVRNFLTDAPMGYTYKIKSGFIGGVRAYAGYVSNKNNEMLCFSVIVNNYNCSPATIRQLIGKLLLKLPVLL